MKLFHLALVVTTTGCLEPRVNDTPGASAHLLPSSATVPSVTDNSELTNQIGLNDGLDDRALAADGKILRGTGLSADAVVHYWSFGPATRAPSPVYQFFAPDGVTRLAHPELVDAVPGDGGYSPLHVIYKVVVTDAYRDELITTIDALGDALALGLVNEPTSTATFVDTPIVLPGTMLEVSDAATAAPEPVYARGYVVGAFRFGGELGLQAGGGLLPTSQVSFLREAHKPVYDADRPIFQATIPTSKAETYTPLSVVINVDLASGILADSITKDGDLFIRAANGAILATTENVAQFEITSSIQLLQLQFLEGSP